MSTPTDSDKITQALGALLGVMEVLRGATPAEAEHRIRTTLPTLQWVHDTINLEALQLQAEVTLRRNWAEQDLQRAREQLQEWIR